MATYTTGPVDSDQATRTIYPSARFVAYTSAAAVVGTILNVVQAIPVYAGETVLAGSLLATDLDTNGTPLLKLDVGDGDDVDRFLADSSIGQTGGFAALNLNLPKTYAAADTIDINVKAAAATAAAGTLTLLIWVVG
jgi:hypothetical protein